VVQMDRAVVEMLFTNVWCVVIGRQVFTMVCSPVKAARSVGALTQICKLNI